MEESEKYREAVSMIELIHSIEVELKHKENWMDQLSKELNVLLKTLTTEEYERFGKETGYLSDD